MKKMTKILLSLASAGIVAVLGGCSTKLTPEPFDPNLRLTPGSVKMLIKEGTTTQQQVFEAVGAPNVVAMHSGKGEIWTYDQIKVRRTAQGYGAGAKFGAFFPFNGDFRDDGIGALANGAGAAGVSASGNIGTITTSVQTATLIIRFNLKGKVDSYSMLVTSF